MQKPAARHVTGGGAPTLMSRPGRSSREVSRLVRETRGASLTEYALIGGAIVIAGFAAFRLLGTSTKQDVLCADGVFSGAAANCVPGSSGAGPSASPMATGGGSHGPSHAGPGQGACTLTACSDVVHCFAAGTPVLTRDGLRPIESIEPGDEVVSADSDTGHVRFAHVTATFVTP